MGIGPSQLGDAILFPAPPASYGLDLPGLVWIEEDFQPLPPLPTLSQAAALEQAAQHTARRRLQRLFPACLIEAPAGSESKCVILYWHGNSCDLGQIFEEMEVLAKYLNCHVFAIEFPGYGIAPPLNGPLPEDVAQAAAAAATAAEGTAASTSQRNAASAEVAALQQATWRARQERKMKTMGETINEWSRSAFNFLVWLGVKPEAIICFGRSIGTGPASYLAATLAEENVRVGGVVLHAPYLSVHKIVQEYSSLGTWLIANHWNNSENLDKMACYSCPLLIIHGEDDEVIPTHHGRKLLERYSAASAKEGYFPADSSHNSYYIIDDLGKPMETFLSEKSRARDCPPLHFSMPAYVSEAPAWQLPALKGVVAATAGAPAGAAAAVAAAADKAAGTTVTGAAGACAAAEAAAAGAIAARAATDQRAAAEQLSQQKGSAVGGVSPRVSSRETATSAGSETFRLAGTCGVVGDASAAGTAAAKTVGDTGLGAAAAAALGRSRTALGKIIAHATGSTGHEWDVGITHTDSSTAAGVTQSAAAPRVSTPPAAKQAGRTNRAATPAAGETEKPSASSAAGAAAKGFVAEPRHCGTSHRFTEVLESGIFSASTLQEIMGETLKELNKAGEDSPPQSVKR